MAKVGRNHPCPCGSGKKYKNCCLNKKPRKRIVMVGSSEPLHGLHYDKEKMEFMGLSLDNRLIKPFATYSQIHYESDSGKEKVISRIGNKVIPDEADLLRYLSTSFDFIIAIDTNTKVIASETISVAAIIHCILRSTPEPNKYYSDILFNGVILFRNCPKELSSEKFGWLNVMKNINRDPVNKMKKYAMVTDHDLDSHISYNNKQIPVFRDFYLPDNFILMYGRGDGPSQNILNYLIKQCDKKATEVLETIEQNGYYQHGESKFSINQIPVPSFQTSEGNRADKKQNKSEP